MLNSRNTIRFMFATYLAVMTMPGCSHLPVKEIPVTANPTEEINKLEAERANAQHQQVDVLSPNYYREAVDHLKTAQEARDKGADTEKILNQVALGRANLEKAVEVSNVARTSLGPVIQARSDAVAAGAPNFFGKELESIDKALRSATEDIEDNDISTAERQQGSLTDRYREIEVASIKADKLGKANDTLKQAAGEGAKENAPRTFEEATNSFSAAEAFIASNPHDKAGIQARSDAATASADHLLSVTRQAKVADKTDSESVVLEREALAKKMEAERTAAEKAQADAAAATAAKQQELSAAQQSAQALEAQNAQLNAEKIDAQKLAAAKALFDPAEADVYQDGNRLIVRLKKIAFPTGKANVTPASFALLGKVQKTISALGASKVTVEGHTDSVGNKNKNQTLSEERADAISNYLSSNGVASTDISTVGYGDTKPIASNKTAEGRAQNRRVDVIIEPTSIAH